MKCENCKKKSSFPIECKYCPGKYCTRCIQIEYHNCEGKYKCFENHIKNLENSLVRVTAQKISKI